MTDMDETTDLPQADPPSLRRRILGVVVTVVVVVAVFAGVIPQFADYGAVGDTIRGLGWAKLGLLLVLGLWFLAAYWFVLISVIPTLRLREAAVNHLSGTAVTNSVPTGGALAVGLNYAMYLSWGFTPSAVTLGLITAGIFDNLVKWGLPAVALSLVAIGAGSAGVAWLVPLVGIGLIGTAITLFGMVLRSDRLASAVGRWASRAATRVRGWAGRPSVDLTERVLELRHSMVTLLRKRWKRLTLATLANHLAMFLVLYGSIRFVGVSAETVGLLPILAAFSVARLLSAVPVTPGGIGVADAGYVALLALSAPDGARPALVAAVLLFRALTFFPPIPLGLGTWLFWRSNRSWRRDWRSERRGRWVSEGSQPT
ncbi:MAG: YbhN family protein [Acidimicrobiia bacterium]|nr:YbhN family protein [Acidimicrobiia bacterium]